MKRILSGLLLAAGLFSSVHADETQIPAEKPKSAVIVTTCSEVVVFVIAWPDGRVVLLDAQSGISAEDAKAVAVAAEGGARVYEVGCFSSTPT